MALNKSFGKWSLVILAASLVALLAVACSDDEEAAPAAAAPAAAPTAAAPPPPASSVASGELVVGVVGLPPLIQLQSKDAPGTVGGFGVWYNVYEPIISAKLMPPKVYPPTDDYVPVLAESWSIAPDQTSITFKIREGIPWHGGGQWGDVTAEDIAWTYNNSFEEGSTGNAGEQLPPGHKIGWDVTDTYTAVMNVAPGGFDPLWGYLHGGNFLQAFGMTNKKAYDALGEEEYLTTAIGTGPFEAEYWRGHDEMLASTVPDHWRASPGFDTLRIIEMPELATREAALRAGEVGITAIPPKVLKGVVDDTGSSVSYVSLPSPNTIYMSGNYWGETCSTCPETDVKNNPWPGAVEALDKGFPWVGDPADPEQMEQARNVRWAMSMAIDRQALVDSILGGFGEPVYGALHTQFPPGDPNFQEAWRVPFDPAGAKQRLADAGYPDGFDVEFWSPTDFSFAWDPEIADAVAEMWRENLDLNVTVSHTPYAARRPQSVDKTMNIPWQHGWGMPAGGSKANFYCAHPGHLGGVTLPDEICEVGFRNDTEPDLQTRIDNNIEMQNYMSFWQVQIGLVTVEPTWAVLPSVKGWQPYMSGDFNNPESVTSVSQ